MIFSEKYLKTAATTTFEQRKRLAGEAFRISSKYDTAIHGFFAGAGNITGPGINTGRKLISGMVRIPIRLPPGTARQNRRSGSCMARKYPTTTLLDIDAAYQLIAEFDETTFAILKHNNACGVASGESLKQTWLDALAADPVSAFGGVLITNREIDPETAEEIKTFL
jgi:phosphoribosylaminoimidazolecarboxamide formyltransferase / IMP cyclohydrolase